MNECKFTKFVRINGQYKIFETADDVIKLQDEEIERLSKEIKELKAFLKSEYEKENSADYKLALVKTWAKLTEMQGNSNVQDND